MIDLKKMRHFTFIFFTSFSFFVCAKASETIDLKTDSVYQLKSKWMSHQNEKKQLLDFMGHEVLVAMMYTRCQHTCPLITSKMKSIEQANAKTKKLQVIMVSFDSDRDTPSHLSAYFKKMHMQKNWTLLTGTESDVRELAAILGVNYKKDSNGEFSHSNVITLLGSDGVIKGQLRSLNEDINKIVDLVH